MQIFLVITTEELNQKFGKIKTIVLGFIKLKL